VIARSLDAQLCCEGGPAAYYVIKRHWLLLFEIAYWQSMSYSSRYTSGAVVKMIALLPVVVRRCSLSFDSWSAHEV
jgi:hypothetical protein